MFGPNGAGKTNLIEAVSMLSPGRGLRGASAEEMARAPEGIGWKVTASLEGVGDGHEVATWSEGAGRQVEIDGKAATQAALGGVARVLWLTPAMDRLWMEGAGERRRFLDRVALSLMPDHGEAAIGYDRELAGAEPADPGPGAGSGVVCRAGGADGGVRGAGGGE